MHKCFKYFTKDRQNLFMHNMNVKLCMPHPSHGLILNKIYLFLISLEILKLTRLIIYIIIIFIFLLVRC